MSRQPGDLLDRPGSLPDDYGLAPTMAPKQNSDDPKIAAALPCPGGAKGIRTPDPLDANEVRYRTAL
jgi:hypothetical protein